jgi:hypothetical protein
VTPATQEVEAGGSQAEGQPELCNKTYQKNKEGRERGRDWKRKEKEGRREEEREKEE